MPVTPTYDLIASNVLSSSASSVTFSSIPATYRDLVLVVNATTTDFERFPRVQFNSDTGSNYNRVSMSGDGSTASSESASAASYFDIYNDSAGFETTAGNFYIMQIMDYSATDKHKTALWRWNKPAEQVLAAAGRWASTSAVTSITCLLNSSSYASGSTFHLYGIAS